MGYNLETKIERLGRVGKATAKKLKKVGIETVKDLVFYYPYRYDDYSKILLIKDLTPGVEATIRGQVQLIENKRSKRKRMIITEALIADDTGTIKAVWFNQPFLTRSLLVGDKVFIAGKVDYDYFGISFTSPSFEKDTDWNQGGTFNTARILPVYSLTANLTVKQLRFLARQVLAVMKQVVDYLPREIKREFQLIDLNIALEQIHFPANVEKLKLAERRLKFDEIFFIQLQNELVRLELQKSLAKPIKFPELEIKNFVASLPFQLTNDQRKAAWEIIQDIGKNQPMNRLLEGDVGSGKTVVAAIAALAVIENHEQAVIMAPTEILAGQHFIGFCRLFAGQKIKIGFLSATNKCFIDAENISPDNLKNTEDNFFVQHKISKKELINKIKLGEFDLLIGTHAIIQAGVEFKDLALAIVDEQHRFGVEQRQVLREKSGSDYCPHFLSMTATPIPRSLALTLYGDLDLSIIKELPRGRQKIITKAVDPINRRQAYDFIRGQIKAGRQTFVVCPLIDESDKLGVKSVMAEYAKLSEEIFPEFKIAFLHGRMSGKDKERVMRDFLAARINVLVATSVVEVGVDVPNASVMMVEGAERFGLSQLHQFRGRVGRSSHQSYCFLFSDNINDKIKHRLNALVDCHDGFLLAEKDLESRGPGEVYGTRQSGLPDLKIASLQDRGMIQLARQAAKKVFTAGLDNYPTIKDRLFSITTTFHPE